MDVPKPHSQFSDQATPEDVELVTCIVCGMEHDEEDIDGDGICFTCAEESE